MKEKSKYVVVDLFAGAGGLSYGFAQTNRFEIKVAFEKDKDAQRTYTENHENVCMMNDVCSANYYDIKEKYGNIDVVIGGPPCQGFSNANRQKNQAINMNNMLIKEYVRAIVELSPKAFVMENVSMLKSHIHRFIISKEDEQLIKTYKIPTKSDIITLLDNEYWFEGVVEIVNDEKKVNKYIWDEKRYLILNNIYKKRNNKEKLSKSLNKYKKELLKILSNKDSKTISKNKIVESDIMVMQAISKFFEGEIKEEKLASEIETAIMYQRMLSKVKELFDNNIEIVEISENGDLEAKIKSYSVYDYLIGVLSSEQYGYVISSGVLCAADFGVPQKRNRFVVMGIKKDINNFTELPRGIINSSEFRTVKDAIEDLENIEPINNLSNDTGMDLSPKHENISNLGIELRNSGKLFNHVIAKNRKVALERFSMIKQGQNFHSLEEKFKINTYANINRTQNTIYLRLDYNKPAGTVVNVRKSMWIHPTKNRAISIREAARLQTFPDSYIFFGNKDSQYQQVGNAVPPLLAKAIAFKLAALLDTNCYQ